MTFLVIFLPQLHFYFQQTETSIFCLTAESEQDGPLEPPVGFICGCGATTPGKTQSAKWRIDSKGVFKCISCYGKNKVFLLLFLTFFPFLYLFLSYFKSQFSAIIPNPAKRRKGQCNNTVIIQMIKALGFSVIDVKHGFPRSVTTFMISLFMKIAILTTSTIFVLTVGRNQMNPAKACECANAPGLCEINKTFFATLYL